MNRSVNRVAFLQMIAISEGTQIIGRNAGYNVIVTSTPEKPILFSSYADHPRRLMHLGKSLVSTAAGRYQILARFYDAYKKQLNLPDFSPDSQDSIAIKMISECGALKLIDAGKIPAAIVACRSRWASLPGAGYGQHENKKSLLISAYLDAGGTLIS